jgi:hypothetical protein
MLDVTSADVEKATRSSFADNYALSELAEGQEQLVASLAAPAEGACDLQIKELAPASVLVQVRGRGEGAGRGGRGSATSGAVQAGPKTVLRDTRSPTRHVLSLPPCCA